MAGPSCCIQRGVDKGMDQSQKGTPRLRLHKAVEALSSNAAWLAVEWSCLPPPPMVTKGALSELADGAADGASLGGQAVAEGCHFARAVDLGEVLLFAWLRSFIRHGVPLPC